MAEKQRGDDRRATERRTDRRPSAVRRAIRSELEGDARDEASVATERDPNVPVVQLENVSLAFDRPILENISLEAKHGETICIVGESGTGKSTTLKLILRLLVPQKRVGIALVGIFPHRRNCDESITNEAHSHQHL